MRSTDLSALLQVRVHEGRLKVRCHRYASLDRQVMAVVTRRLAEEVARGGARPAGTPDLRCRCGRRGTRRLWGSVLVNTARMLFPGMPSSLRWRCLFAALARRQCCCHCLGEKGLLSVAFMCSRRCLDTARFLWGVSAVEMLAQVSRALSCSAATGQ